MIDNCIFCKIANGQIPSSSPYEDENFKVILDLSPASKGHALILPKEHFEGLDTLSDSYMTKILPLARKIGSAMKEALGATGYNVLQNNGESAGQTVMHYHMHIIPRYDGGPKMVTWEPGESTSEELAQIASMIQSRL